MPGPKDGRRSFARTDFPPDMIRLLSAVRPATNYAALVPDRAAGRRLQGGSNAPAFRDYLSIALTVGGAYGLTAGAGGARTANGDAVARNVDGVTNFVRDGWRKITG